jgi:hypothetical protein
VNEGPKLVFVGGTGRSGTHIVGRLLGEHSAFHMIPIECRFHCNPFGLADVVTGKSTPEEFLRKLRGFWWRRRRVGPRALVGMASRARGGGRVRGLHKIVDGDRFEVAVAAFEAGFPDDPVEASRNLFFDLLAPLAEKAHKPGIVEMSCFTIAAAPGLARIFPEARFVHSVRDGRDAGSSKAAKRQKEHHPRGVSDGIDWWLGRLRQAEEGVRGLTERERLLAISLDDLVSGDREGVYRELRAFLGLEDEPQMREFFDRHINADAAHRERWRERLTAGQQEEVRERYEAALEQLERERFHCAEVLRRSYERVPQTAG